MNGSMSMKRLNVLILSITASMFITHHADAEKIIDLNVDEDTVRQSVMSAVSYNGPRNNIDGFAIEEMAKNAINMNKNVTCTQASSPNDKIVDFQCKSDGRGRDQKYQVKSGLSKGHIWAICQDLSIRTYFAAGEPKYRGTRLLMTSDTNQLVKSKCPHLYNKMDRRGMIFATSERTQDLRNKIIAVHPELTQKVAGHNSRAQKASEDTILSDRTKQVDNGTQQNSTNQNWTKIARMPLRLNPVVYVVAAGVGTSGMVFSQNTLDACGVTWVREKGRAGGEWFTNTMIPEVVQRYSRKTGQHVHRMGRWVSSELDHSILATGADTATEYWRKGNRIVYQTYQDSFFETFVYAADRRVRNTCNWMHFQGYRAYRVIAK